LEAPGRGRHGGSTLRGRTGRASPGARKGSRGLDALVRARAGLERQAARRGHGSRGEARSPEPRAEGVPQHARLAEPPGGREVIRRDPFAQPEELVRRLYSYVAYVIGDGPDAEDVTSEAFERGLRY